MMSVTRNLFFSWKQLWAATNSTYRNRLMHVCNKVKKVIAIFLLITCHYIRKCGLWNSNSGSQWSLYIIYFLGEEYRRPVLSGDRPVSFLQKKNLLTIFEGDRPDSHG